MVTCEYEAHLRLRTCKTSLYLILLAHYREGLDIMTPMLMYGMGRYLWFAMYAFPGGL